ncbi:MAG: lytic murein transglycosylase [Rhodospirillaceae bacterium]|nr:lytic murein transglycosylase [Rhodospirillaceae bacterium]
MRTTSLVRLAAIVLGCLGWSLPAQAQQTQPFEAWLEELRAEARAAGISEQTLAEALTGVEPVARVIERDRNQAESRLDFWTYVDRVVSDARIEEGQRRLVADGELLDDVAHRYGIPARILVATWGIESSFGRFQGNDGVISSLVTLAYDPRRAAFFRRELLHALRIIDDGHISAADMKGSWAGAMGQLQFMPSTFIDYAMDGDGDGRKDIWGSPADAIESAANYMAAAWRPGYIWGRQVALPGDFDPSTAGLDAERPLAEWSALGVRRIDGTALPAVDVSGAIVLPNDGLEPAFLVYQNYRAILRWNRSHLFAIALGHLADRIGGQPALAR